MPRRARAVHRDCTPREGAAAGDASCATGGNGGAPSACTRNRLAFAGCGWSQAKVWIHRNAAAAQHQRNESVVMDRVTHDIEQFPAEAGSRATDRSRAI